MDALIAILTPGFNENKWTDQEVGVAIGRHVSIVLVKIGMDPYGFIGKYQALQGKGKTLERVAEEIIEILIIKSNIGLKVTEGLIKKFIQSNSWAESKSNMSLLEKCKFFNPGTSKKLKEALKENSQIGDSWGVPDRIKALIKRISSQPVT